MRIITSSIPDFIKNLADAKVFRDVVYFDKTSRPMGNKPKREATSFEIYYQTTAVLEYDEGQALLVCGTDCGIDRFTGDGGLEGSREQETLHGKLKSFCEERKLRLMPGVLDQ